MLTQVAWRSSGSFLCQIQRLPLSSDHGNGEESEIARVTSPLVRNNPHQGNIHLMNTWCKVPRAESDIRGSDSESFSTDFSVLRSTASSMHSGNCSSASWRLMNISTW